MWHVTSTIRICCSSSMSLYQNVKNVKIYNKFRDFLRQKLRQAMHSLVINIITFILYYIILLILIHEHLFMQAINSYSCGSCAAHKIMQRKTSFSQCPHQASGMRTKYDLGELPN